MLKIVSSQPHRPNDLERQELLERLFARLSTLRRTIPAGILSRRLPAASTTECATSSICSATSCAPNPVARKISEETGYRERERGRGRGTPSRSAGPIPRLKLPIRFPIAVGAPESQRFRLGPSVSSTEGEQILGVPRLHPRSRAR